MAKKKNANVDDIENNLTEISKIAENALKAYESIYKRKNVTDFVVYVKPEENAA